MATGPAAGLTAIVASGIATLGSFSALLTTVLIADARQLAFSAPRLGVVGYFMPSSLTKGILASIGIVLAVLVLLDRPALRRFRIVPAALSYWRFPTC